MSDKLQITALSRSGRDISRFLKVAYPVFENDPHWVAPLLMDLKKVFTNSNPLFKHARMQLWVASRNGRDVGRIAGVVDEHHNKTAAEPTAFFGFFDCLEDAEVSHALFQAMFDWARKSGLKKVMGPMNPTTNDECGLLVEGFDSSPVFMMTYNPAYYVKLVEAEGFKKAKDLLAFHLDLARIPMERLNRIANLVKKRHPEITLRPLRRKTLARDLVKVKEVYNAAWEDNWGFIPMTDEEMDFMADRLKPLLMEGLIWLAETKDKPVGFLLALPDYNVAFKPLGGKLFTPKIFGFIPYVLGWKCPTMVRVITLGMIEGYRNKGLESALLIEGLNVGIAAGVKESEASWILEDNVMMCRVLETIGGRIYKRYRIYERSEP